MRSSGQDLTQPIVSITHNPVLDSIRGWAILLVLMVHCVAFQPAGSSVLSVVNEVARAGWLGVDLFFVLSGYLITSILLSTRQTPGYFVNFYARRALRIFPAYYLYLVVVFLVLPHVLAGVSGESLRAWALSSALYLQNIQMLIVGGATSWRGLDHLWSLAIEEHFYLFWPLIVGLFPARRLLVVCVALIATAWAVKALLVLFHDWPLAAYVFMPARMDALAAGALVACLPHGWNKTTGRLALLVAVVAAAGLLAIAFSKGGLRLSGGVNIALITSLAALAFAALLHVIVMTDFKPMWLHNPVLVTFGRYSYGMYLIHIAVIELFQVPLLGYWQASMGYNTASLLSGVATMLVTLLVAMLSYHLFEMRFLKLKRYFSSKSAA